MATDKALSVAIFAFVNQLYIGWCDLEERSFFGGEEYGLYLHL